MANKRFPSNTVTVCVGAIVLAGAMYLIRQLKGLSDDGTDDSDQGSFTSGSGIPSHLQRLMYKQERRNLSISNLSMKKPMYDNIEMYSPDGTLLCTISKTKAKWYIKKGLGRWIVVSTSLQLLFLPKGRPDHGDGKYNQTQKKNRCVVCGDTENFMRHYIVPYCYRQLFPIKYKTHLPHDIVILCPDCHLESEQQTQRRQKELDASLRKTPESAPARIPNKSLRKVKSVALALRKRRDQLPQAKQEECEQIVKDHFCLDKASRISPELLDEASKMETTTENPLYVPGPELVIAALAYDPSSIERFVVEWRQFFIDTMHPQFLPTGWSTYNPVRI